MGPIKHQQPSHLEDLTDEECLEHLGYGAYVGRLGFIRDGRPIILPVNYLVEGREVVFRSAEGSVLAALDGELVAFEVDSTRPLEHAGWSVLAHGTVRRVIDQAELEKLRRGALRSWAWMAADEWFRVRITAVSGRRLGRG